MSKSQPEKIKEFLVNSPENRPKAIFLFAHGAGNGMSTPFMETIAKGITRAGVRVVRFHFPYMEEMVRSGKQTAPNGGGILRKCFSEVITHWIERENIPGKSIIIGGKAMGARAASKIADDHKVAGVICFGYPFHPPRKPNSYRIKNLQTTQTPTLICQGERDPKGRLEEIQRLNLSTSVQFHWLTDGDSDFKPRKNSVKTLDENMNETIEASNNFISGILKPRDKQ